MTKADRKAIGAAECLKKFFGITFHSPARIVFKGGVELLVDVTVKAGRGRIRFPEVVLREPHIIETAEPRAVSAPRKKRRQAASA